MPDILSKSQRFSSIRSLLVIYQKSGRRVRLGGGGEVRRTGAITGRTGTGGTGARTLGWG